MQKWLGSRRQSNKINQWKSSQDLSWFGVMKACVRCGPWVPPVLRSPGMATASQIPGLWVDIEEALLSTNTPYLETSVPVS